MNITNLQILLQEAIDNSTSTVDWLLLSKAVQALRVGQIRSVTTYADLPSAASNEGLLVWVTADERLYWSTASAWFSIVSDNRGLPLSWGSNTYGRLGDNTTTIRSSPVSVVGGLSDWCTVSAGGCHSLALRGNGTVWSWGCNVDGSLGNNTTTSRLSPVSVVGGFTNWCQASAGCAHTVAVRSSGSAWAWGNNIFGRLGDNTQTNRSSPVSVVGGFSDWCQASAGWVHSAAVRTNGTVWAWGANTCGRLGDNTTTARTSPVSVIGGFTDWSTVSAGFNHNLAIRTQGTIWSWGTNEAGRLGDNTTTDRSSPVSVVGGLVNWCQASAGISHSAALTTNGSVWAWGCNGTGVLGHNTTTDSSSPVSVVGGITNWCCISTGRFLSSAVRSSGSAWAWGLNNCGALGDNTSTNRSSPVSIVGGFSDWCSISAGHYHMLGLRQTNFT
jgi:alpha-tubulin suppressor-like RCC1 family protein